MKRATACANANIALVKYWGKADSVLNIPAVPSLSMTLNDIGTTVTVSEATHEHQLFIDHRPTAGPALIRLVNYLEQARIFYPYDGFLCVKSTATVPYAAGLASSASFFAALATALNHFLSLNLDDGQRSALARLGSASAARSIFGGLASLPADLITHEEARAFALTTPLKLVMLIATLNEGPKKISSREAMNLTAKTSPFYPAFVQSSALDFTKAKSALKAGFFSELGSVMEHSTLKMHASMWASKPSINYFLPKTLELIDLLYQLRDEHGPIAFFTIDAGPNVKILCEQRNASLVAHYLSQRFNNAHLAYSIAGPGAHLVDNDLS